MPGNMTTRTFFRSAATVVERVYTKSALKEKPYYPLVFNTAQAAGNRSFETYQPIIPLGTFAVKPEQMGAMTDAAFEGIPTTFNLVTYSLQYGYSEEASLEDAKKNLKLLPQFLVYSRQITEDLLYWQTLNLGFTVNGPDGVPLFSAAHPLQGLSGQVISNYAGAVALTPDSLNSALIAYDVLQDDRGLPRRRDPALLVVSPYLRKQAKEIVGTEYVPYSGDNTINTLQDSLKVLSCRYITSPTSWFVLGPKGGVDGNGHSLTVLYRYKDRNYAWFDESVGMFYHRAAFRSGFGWVDFRGTYASQGA